MKHLIMLMLLSLLSGCITVYECEGDHQETYNNISPTTQESETATSK
ncbi:hypothetical protein [Orbus sasakiae]